MMLWWCNANYYSKIIYFDQLLSSCMFDFIL